MDRLGRSYTFPASYQEMQKKTPRSRLQGVTEIRGPYYSVMGPTYLEDILEAQGHFVDGLKFAGGSLTLMPREKVKLITALAHKHGIYVNTGGWADQMLAKGPRFFNQYVRECKDLGFDIVELSNEFLQFREDDLMRLIRTVKNAGLKAKPEILFEPGRGTTNEHCDREKHEDLELLMKRAERCLEAGAYMILIESDGLTRNVPSWRTDVLAAIVGRLGLERTMFEANEPNVSEWFIRNYGSKVNLYVNHSDAGHLEGLRSEAVQSGLKFRLESRQVTLCALVGVPIICQNGMWPYAQELLNVATLVCGKNGMWPYAQELLNVATLVCGKNSSEDQLPEAG